jgi:hypothetical protein
MTGTPTLKGQCPMPRAKGGDPSRCIDPNGELKMEAHPPLQSLKYVFFRSMTNATKRRMKRTLALALQCPAGYYRALAQCVSTGSSSAAVQHSTGVAKQQMKWHLTT